MLARALRQLSEPGGLCALQRAHTAIWASAICGLPAFGNGTKLFPGVPYHGRTHLEFRAEAFNVTNSVRLDPVPNDVLGGTFGRITTDYSTTGSSSPTGSGGRIVQLAMKYVF